MKSETQSFYEVAVQRAVEQVIQSLDEALDLQTLARRAALSSFHFHRVFRGMVGETPLELHRRLRLERAAWSLLHTEDAVTTVAFGAGYETHESFTRAFRAHYACSPSEFRQRRPVDGGEWTPPVQIALAARSSIHFGTQPSADLRVPFITFIKGERAMDVQIKQLPARRLVTVSHVGPYNRIAEAFARLGQLAGQHGLIGPGTEMMAIFHDDPETTPLAELRSDAALTIATGATIPPGMGEFHLEAGRYACTRHVGPYEQLGDVWARFMGEWLPESGLRMRDGVTYELYLNTPGTVPVEQLVTELYLPLVD